MPESRKCLREIKLPEHAINNLKAKLDDIICEVYNDGALQSKHICDIGNNRKCCARK